jgi:YVTN family beta-propeller protein
MLKLRSFAVLALVAVAFTAGCSGGGKRRTSQSSTVAPITSTPAPVNSGNTVIPPVVVTPVTTATTTTGKPEIYVASLLLNNVTVMDVAAGTQKAQIAVGKGPMAVAVNKDYAFTANSLGQNVSCIDLLTNTVAYEMDAAGAGITNLPLIGNTVDPLLKALVRPTGIAVKPDGTKAFSANLINVTSYDLIGKKPLKSIFSLNLQFSLGGGNILAAIQQSLQSFLAQPLAALGQARIACTDKTAFCTNMITNNVTVFSASDDRVITYTPVGKLPMGVACAANKAYVACAISNEIYVLDETTGKVLNHFAAGQVPVDCAASPKGDFIYVANFLGGDVTVIDTAADLAVNVLPCGLNIGSIFQQLGVPIPASSGSGIGGAITNFLGGFLGGAGTNGGIGGLLGGSGPIGMNNVLSGLMSAFLGFAGINQSTINSLTMPGIGVMGVAVSADGSRVCSANLLTGLNITEIATNKVSSPGFLTGQSLGSASVAAAR